MKVLLLNASEEFLSVLDWKRAVRLLMCGKVRPHFAPIRNYSIRTVTKEFLLPSVVVLTSYVHRPYKVPAVSKKNLLKRDGFVCQFCGRKLSSTTGTIEHLTPVSRGGAHNWKNVVAACKQCNNRKDNRTREEAQRQLGMILKSEPFVPRQEDLDSDMLSRNWKELELCESCGN